MTIKKVLMIAYSCYLEAQVINQLSKFVNLREARFSKIIDDVTTCKSLPKSLRIFSVEVFLPCNLNDLLKLLPSSLLELYVDCDQPCDLSLFPSLRITDAHFVSASSNNIKRVPGSVYDEDETS